MPICGLGEDFLSSSYAIMGLLYKKERKPQRPSKSRQKKLTNGGMHISQNIY